MSAPRVAALRLLTRRDYTAAEIQQKLIDREFSPDVASDTVERLVADGLLNDRRVAAAFVRTASTIKGRGRLRIQRELEARGIDRALARELVGELPEADETEAIARFLARKRVAAALSPAEHRRLFAQLLRRGFSVDLISRALRTRRRT